MTVKQQSPGSGGNSAQDKAQEKQKENEAAAEEMQVLEAGDPPTDLDDWPSGPANLERFADGSVAVDGAKVDNPGDYRGEPIAGGPTDHAQD